jgi:hypothetical protein
MPLVNEFATVWQDRDPETLDDLYKIVAEHVVPVHRLAVEEWVGGGAQGEPVLVTPVHPPLGSDLLKARYREMRSALRKDWREFVDGLPFEVKSQYLSWCSDFLKGE